MLSIDKTHELNARFGRGMWHTYATLDQPFGCIDGGRCYCCEAPAVKRCEVNTWGVICDYDLCQVHVDRYDGKNVDDVERRQVAC